MPTGCANTPIFGLRRAPERGLAAVETAFEAAETIKVFCFFSSEKKNLLS
jgi:hypothetical protein